MKEKTNSLMTRLRKNMKKNYNAFIQILTITSHHLQLTQVSWMYTTITHTNSLTMQNILSSITSEYYVKTRAPISKQVIFILANVQLYGGLKSHVFTDITMFTYSRPVKCNVKILNVRKYPAKVFGLVIIKIPKYRLIYHSSYHNVCHKT